MNFLFFIVHPAWFFLHRYTINELMSRGHEVDIDFEYVVLQPIPNPPTPDLGAHAYIERVPREILSAVKELII